MLGKLARWLRMMGYDTKYSNSMDDAALLFLAKDEKRVLLTRDFALYQLATEKGLETSYVNGLTEPERLAEIAYKFDIPLSINLEQSRCPKCNAKIVSVPKNEIADKIQKNTLTHYEQFWLCPNCGAVYWQGAHWKNIDEVFKKAKMKQKEKD
jgi:uncharacterized protein with PIN domain